LTFGDVTAFFFSCLPPTDPFGKATAAYELPANATKSASRATSIAGDGFRARIAILLFWRYGLISEYYVQAQRAVQRGGRALQVQPWWTLGAARLPQPAEHIPSVSEGLGSRPPLAKPALAG